MRSRLEVLIAEFRIQAYGLQNHTVSLHDVGGDVFACGSLIQLGSTCCRQYGGDPTALWSVVARTARSHPRDGNTNNSFQKHC